MEGDHQWKTIGKPYLIGGLEHVFFPIIRMRMSSSQLTNSLHHFSAALGKKHTPDYYFPSFTI